MFFNGNYGNQWLGVPNFMNPFQMGLERRFQNREFRGNDSDEEEDEIERRERNRMMREHIRNRGREDNNLFMREERNYDDIDENNIVNQDENIYLEDLIYFPKKIYPKDDDEEDLNIISLSKFKEININKLKEDIFYYCASPETLLKLNQNIDEERNYELYKDLFTENFLYSQKEKNNIFKNKNIKIKSLIKSQKLSNYNDSLCLQMSNPPSDNNFQEKNLQFHNAFLILNKIEDITNIYKEIEEKKLLDKLKELLDIISKNKIEIKLLGFLIFSSIENNLCTLLNLIIDIFDKKNNEDNLITLGNILKEIQYNFKSIKVLFIFIKFCSSHQNILNSIKIDENKPNQFLSEDSLNFN